MTQTLSWVAKQQVVAICSSVNRPACDRRAISACTFSEDSTSTPRWLILPPWPGLSMRTSFNGGVGDREIRVAGLALGGLDTEQGRVELDGLLEIVDVECELNT